MLEKRKDDMSHEPIAIIGIGCHFPGGATSPNAYWEMLCSGFDATRELPAQRWEVRKFYDPDMRKSGKTSTFRGGYLDHIDQFDAHFFGISPREAIWLDPQQRLLLQVAWEAMEDAGQVVEQLAGSDTGVFIGGFTLDYQLLQNYGVYSRYQLQTHSATGMMMTMLANRLSYVFDFRGPSMSVDTACSASLVAVHLAVQAIHNGECSMALAGGSNVMIAPNMTIAESKGGFLSSDGRCKTFDAAANGYARGEGAGVVLLKPLSQALLDKDPIYAVVRGTAVSQDGHTNGITVPSQVAQETAMRKAFRRAGIAPHQVQYVEAHGTGTPVGDPVEARAIGNVLSKGRPEGQRCVIGSVKTNIGHLEAAAGIAGLTKVAMALKNGQIPPHLNLRNPNPDIPFDELQLRVPTRLEEWPDTDGPRRAGVNSFGFGGTNAHVILEEAPASRAPISREPEGKKPYLIPLSARSPEALTALARSYQDYLTIQPHSLNDIGFSASLRRSHHDHRLTVVASSKEDAAEKLAGFLDGNPTPGVSSGRVPPTGQPKIAFVCSGMGPQWWAMARELLATEPVFRIAVERCDAELKLYTGWSLLEAMLAPEEESRMAETEVAQPANFAIQIGLAALWRSWGIEPDAIVGHSTGEVAAQYLSGVLSFEDAVRVNYYRSSLQQRTTGQGKMLAVGMTPETLHLAVRDAGPMVSVAAINSPSAVTVAGDPAILESMAAQLEQFGVFHRFLTVKVPYHSHFMDPLRDDLLKGLEGLSPGNARIPLYSTVTGTRIDGGGADANYWWQNVRSTVLFAAAATQMIADGYTVFVELSPHPVLASSLNELLAQQGQSGVVVPSMRRKESDTATMLGSLGTLYANGCPVAWHRFYDSDSTFVRLPSYPWQFKSYWNESPEAREDRHYQPVHPLLGQRMNAPHPTWEVELDSRHVTFLADHRIQDNVPVPGAAFIEMALAAAREVYGEGFYTVEDLQFRKALLLTEMADPRLRTILHQERATIEICSYGPTAGGEGFWTVHATAKLCQRRPVKAHLNGHSEQIPDATHFSREEFYEQTQQMGFQYGAAFQAVQAVDVGAGRAIGLVEIPIVLIEELGDYIFHPSLVDAAFQVLLTAARPLADSGQSTAPFLPVGIDRIRICGRPADQMQVAAQVIHADARLIVSDIRLADMDGNVLVEIEGFRAQSLEASSRLTPERIDRSLFEVEWVAQPRPQREDEPAEPMEPPEPGTWLILTDHTGVGASLTQSLVRQGHRVVTVGSGKTTRLAGGNGGYLLDPTVPEQFVQLLEREQVTQVVHLWSLDSSFTETSPLSTLEAEQQRGAQSVMYLLQALSQAGSQLPRVWLVTRRAQAVGENPGPVAIEQAPVWGIGRVVGHQEFKSMWGGLIDVGDGPAAHLAEQLLAEMTDGGEEDQIAFRGGERYVARLTESKRLTPPLPPSLRADGTYVVTGGLGALGLLVARFLVERGANRLVLMGRTKLPDRSVWRTIEPDHPQYRVVNKLLELEQLGANLRLASVDVTDEASLRQWLAAHESAALPPIRGVIHTAGVVRDELLVRMTTEQFQKVLRPKVHGGWLLHRVLQSQPLDFFVLFSSTGAVIASPGQGNYAAGNAFLDALAHHRQNLGLPGLSIGWGPWSVGMVEQLQLEQIYTRRGIDLITPEAGMQMLARVLGQRPAYLTAISVNWVTARETSPLGELPPMFALLGTQEGDQASEDEGDGQSLLAQLAAAPAADRAAIVTMRLKEMAARVLQLDPESFSEEEPITSLGMDSMMAIEVKHRIEATLKVDVSVLELLQGATIAGMATRIVGALQLEESAPMENDNEIDIIASIDELERLISQAAGPEIEQLLIELERDLR
jgi:acyl transferase domain-containing protein/acyl carrier protein